MKRTWQARHPKRIGVTVMLTAAVYRVCRIIAHDERTSVSGVISEMVHASLGIPLPVRRGKRRSRKRQVRR